MFHNAAPWLDDSTRIKLEAQLRVTPARQQGFSDTKCSAEPEYYDSSKVLLLFYFPH